MQNLFAVLLAMISQWLQVCSRASILWHSSLSSQAIKVKSEKYVKIRNEALPGALRNRGKGHLFRGGGRRPNFEGNRETKTIFGNRDIRKQFNFHFLGTGEQGN